MYHEGDLVPGVPDPTLREGIEEAVVNRPAYERVLEDQKCLESGLNITYLTQTLAAFPNLETVIVDDAFKPWGTALERQIGVPMANGIEGLDSIEFVMQTLRAIILAIAAAGQRFRNRCRFATTCSRSGLPTPAVSRSEIFRGERQVTSFAFQPVIVCAADAGPTPSKSDARPRTVLTLTMAGVVPPISPPLGTSRRSNGYTAYSSLLCTPCACPARKQRRSPSFL